MIQHKRSSPMTKESERTFEKITAPFEWSKDCATWLQEARTEVARKIYEKYGETVKFPMFLHIDICNSMKAIFHFAPDREEAIRFINAALKEVSDKHKEFSNE